MKIDWEEVGLFAGGVLFGTAGIKILTSRDAKTLYTHVTAAVLRMKDCVMQTATNFQDDCSDILAGAKSINEARAEEERSAEMSDTAE